jgi:hypothetical protein
MNQPPTIQPIDIVNLVIQGVVMAIVLGLRIRRIAVGGYFWSSFFRMWMGMVIWALLFCLIIPSIIAFAFHTKHVFEHFPEGPGVVAAFMIGWLPCLILCSLTWLIRGCWTDFSSPSKPR